MKSAKSRGVPGPKIYGALAKLVEKGLDYLIDGNIVRYYAPWRNLFARQGKTSLTENQQLKQS